MSHNMIIPSCYLPYFQTVLYCFLQSTLVLFFYRDVVVMLSVERNLPIIWNRRVVCPGSLSSTLPQIDPDTAYVVCISVSLGFPYIKRKPPCIGGMELVSLSCNRVFISAESVGRGWCKIAIATKWYQFHTTDKCGFLFMPWITDQYTFVQYTKLVNK